MKNAKLKALFVTHNYGLYGASKSLQLLLKNNADVDVTLIIPRKEILTKRDRDKIGQKFGTDGSRVLQFFLPWNHCFEGRKTDRRSKTIVWLKNMLWKTNRHAFYREIRNGGYDYIHLNSPVLCDLIDAAYPFVIHIREFIDLPSDWIIKQIQRANGVIFIDRSVSLPFRGVRLKDAVILSNPVDMRPVQHYPRSEPSLENSVVVSMIGRIEESKGAAFVIETFRKTPAPQLRLLVVGGKGDGTQSDYVQNCCKIAADDSRIVFWGEEKDILKIYALSDYVIRGDVDFRMGRSILEALYSDCRVIVPSSDPEIIKKDTELNKFQKNVHLYLPRDQTSLGDLLLSLGHLKVAKKHFNSNVSDYVKRFNEYMKGRILRKG